MKLATNAHASGKITSLEVIRDGKVVNRINDIGNLLLNDARASYFVFAPSRCWTHTDATANSILLNGSFEQTGTTITRVSGTGVFTSGMVGDTVKFGSGERATIVTYTSATEVQVSSAESQIVAASSLTVWGTSFSFSDAAGSDIQEATSATTIEDTVDGAGGTLTREYEFNFSASGSDYTLASVSFGTPDSCYARIVLPSPVSVLTGDQLRIRYRYVKSMTNLLVPLSAQPSPISGLPFVYSLTAIVANGSYFDIATPIDHHYEAGDTITISGAIPTKSNITSITPNGSVWTVLTSTTHGLSASDSVTIEDSTVTEYNGDWTVAGVTDPNTYTITNATSPSTGSDGTSRATTPGSYFDGTYTVASVPDSTTVRVTSALTVTDAGSGSLTTPDGCSIALGRGGGTNYWVKTVGAKVHPGAGNFGQSGRFIDPDNEITEPANQAAIVNLTSQGTGGAIWSSQSFASSSPVLANGFILTNQVSINTSVVATRFNQVIFADSANSTIWYFGITYDHPQAKPDGYSLTFAVTCNYLQELA